MWRLTLVWSAVSSQRWSLNRLKSSITNFYNLKRYFQVVKIINALHSYYQTNVQLVEILFYFFNKNFIFWLTNKPLKLINNWQEVSCFDFLLWLFIYYPRLSFRLVCSRWAPEKWVKTGWSCWVECLTWCLFQ